MTQRTKAAVITLLLFFALTPNTFSWSEHPLMVYPVLKSIPGFDTLKPVEARSLLTFLAQEEKGLEKLLADYETWAASNLSYYAPLPSSLAFVSTGNPEDILNRFFRAIRVNPNVRMRLYLHLLPGQSDMGLAPISPADLTTLSKISDMHKTRYVEISEGYRVSPMHVLCTANDEPDYGFDVGLFEDNNTAWGSAYGFGIQPFGDPKLEYGSQAPFHMGFYHEPAIVFKFGPFLKKTMPEYRIQLYKALSEYAFSVGEDYWGWRFMGWGMHYLGDLSMPYHAAPLPGVSAFRMIWMNIKAILGFPGSKDRAVQLVSNRHSVLEKFQWVMLRRAYDVYDEANPLLFALCNPSSAQPYTSNFPRYVVAHEAKQRSGSIDRVLEQNMPEMLVSDPSFETSGSEELEKVVESATQERGAKAIEAMTVKLAEIFSSYSMHIRAYLSSIETLR